MFHSLLSKRNCSDKGRKKKRPTNIDGRESMFFRSEELVKNQLMAG